MKTNIESLFCKGEDEVQANTYTGLKSLVFYFFCLSNTEYSSRSRAAVPLILYCLMQAECLFMMGSLEKSLRYWHKAAKLRPNQDEVIMVRMRSSLVVRASGCHCKFCNSPGFITSIRQHSGI